MELSLELTAMLKPKLELLVHQVVAELAAIGVQLLPKGLELPTLHPCSPPAEEYR